MLHDARLVRLFVHDVSGSEAGDQKRFMTPAEAIEAGADYLVIGRPITAAADPRKAVAKILEDIGG